MCLTFLQVLNLSRLLPPSTATAPLMKRLHLGRGIAIHRPRLRPSIQIPDRYILPRENIATIRDIMFTSKPVTKLSREERLLRRGNDFDTFAVHPRPRPRPAEPMQYSHTARHPRLSLFHADEVPSIGRGVLVNANRHSSNGISGVDPGLSFVSAPGGVISDGRGGFLGAETNAPLFTSRFLGGPLPVMDLYEKRLANAFDVDQTNKVLGGRPLETPAKIEWINNQWMRQGCVIGKWPTRRREC